MTPISAATERLAVAYRLGCLVAGGEKGANVAPKKGQGAQDPPEETILDLATVE
jgi:hypothetical protein